jgi:hypothetical protein
MTTGDELQQLSQHSCGSLIRRTLAQQAGPAFFLEPETLALMLIVLG